MLYEIEKAFKTALEAAGLGFKAVEEKGENPVDSTPTPAALPIVGDGDLERLIDGKWKCTVEIGVLLLVKDVSGEPNRRRAVLPLIEGVTRLFAGQTLGLAIKKIRPRSFGNTTTEAFRKKGLIAYIIGFETDFVLLENDPEADALDLLRIGLDYFLQDPADDGAADAEDLVGEQYPRYSAGFSFDGSGINDFNTGGYYVGLEITEAITLTALAGAPDRVLVAIGEDSVEMDMPTAETDFPGLPGATFWFDSDTGHTDGDKWTIELSLEEE